LGSTNYGTSISSKEKVLGKENPSTLTSVENLGLVLSNQQKCAEAEETYERTLEGYEKALSHDHDKCKGIRQAI
jgi:hypothetical protein